MRATCIPILGLLILPACASSGGTVPAEGIRESPTTIETFGTRYQLDMVEDVSVYTDSVEVDLDALWNALPDVYRELGIPVGAVNFEARLVGNTGFRVRGDLGDTRVSRFLRCGSGITGANADRYPVSIEVVTQLEATEGPTLIHSYADGIATSDGVRGNPIACTTTGRLEELIANTLTLRAAAN